MDERAGGRILLVDDTPENLVLLDAQLSREGYVTERASSGPVALSLAESANPDLIILDVLMPGMDGYQVCRQLKANPSTRAIPVIMLTGLSGQTERLHGLEAGADDFLTKPVDRAELLARVRSSVRMKWLYDEVARSRDEADALARTLEQRVESRTRELHQALEALQAMQQQVIQQERLRALGQMASGIAHDFNNALAPIVGFAELLLAPDGLADPEKVRRYLELMQSGAEDAASVVRRLREFYRPRDDAEFFEPIDLAELVEEVIALTQPRWRDQALAENTHITIVRDYTSTHLISGDPAALREALTNLLFNAVDAISGAGGVGTGAGTITLCTHDDREYVLVDVADTGAGMSEDVRRRCLEPFFTTKGPGGSGLGLAMLHGIVQRHGGSIDIQSAPGRGTTFTLRLPAAPATTGASLPAQSTGVPTSSAARRILIVDDEPHIRIMLTQILTMDGHTVYQAENGQEGLRTFQQQPVDLVISDIAMPVMNGEALAAAVKAQSPGTPVVLLTGFGDAISATGVQPHGADLVLSKPASIEVLRRAVAQFGSPPGRDAQPQAATSPGKDPQRA